jgi:hypothetical protein
VSERRAVRKDGITSFMTGFFSSQGRITTHDTFVANVAVLDHYKMTIRNDKVF